MPGEELTLEEFQMLPAAARVSLRRYGQRTRLVLSDVTLVAATAAQLVSNNPDRLSVLVSNTGVTNPFTLTDALGKTVTQGDVIGPNGGAYAMDALTDGEATGREVDAISTAGTTVHIEEIIGYGPVVKLPPGIQPL